MIHTVKGFGIDNKTEREVFLEICCFFHDSADVDSFKAWPKEAEIIYHHKRFYRDAAQPKARPAFYIIKQNGYQRCLEHLHLESRPPNE